ncbi:MAG: hypothetical protein FVQ84_08635 [Planctomycetes bacterium]|nr:hypothetical protein [Planctomycetota bacterium]
MNYNEKQQIDNLKEKVKQATFYSKFLKKEQEIIDNKISIARIEVSRLIERRFSLPNMIENTRKDLEYYTSQIHTAMIEFNKHDEAECLRNKITKLQAKLSIMEDDWQMAQ